MRSDRDGSFGVIGILVLVGVLRGLALAQDQADEGREPLEVETVVSATRTPIPKERVTSSVEVITGDELKRRKIKTVVDALRLSPGLAVFSSGGPGTLASVRMRGGSANQTLVLIDGAVANSPTTGEFDFANLTVDNIERIEILRGAQSMLWGADAMGGVINIITKRGRGTPTFNGYAEYGSFLSIREGGRVGGKKGPIDFALALSRWDFTGFSAVNYRRGATERDAFRNWQASARLGADLPTDGRLEFDFRWMNGTVDFDNGDTAGPFDVFKAKNSTRQFVFSGTYEQPLTDWWNQTLTLARFQEHLRSQSGTFQRNVVTGAVTPVFPFPADISTLTNRIAWQHNVQIGKPLLLTAGYQLREALGDNTTATPPFNKIISSNSGFAQAQLNLADRFFATAGFRQDSYNTFGDATTWRATAGYLHRPTGTKLRTSYATGFRAPSINELFFPSFGNPFLKPEKNQSFDIGVDQVLLDERLQLNATYFWNRFRDLITTTFDPVRCTLISPFGFCPLNIGSAKSQGLEVGATYTWAPGLRWLERLDLRGQYTHTLTRDLITGARLPRWPVHQWSGKLGYRPLDPLQIDLYFRYVGRRFNTTGNQQPIGSFTVFNLVASYDVTSQVQGYVRVDNLLNEKYEEVLNFGIPVRSIFGGIRMNLDLPFGGSL